MDKESLKLSEEQKLEKQLCNCYSLEYCQVSKLELSPFTALLNLLKNKYEATPEIFRTVVCLLLEYDPTSPADQIQKTIRSLKVLLEKNHDLADCLISMLPEASSPDDSFTVPLAALPTKAKQERWKGIIPNPGSEDTSKPSYYNYSTPAVTSYIATQGVPSAVTSTRNLSLHLQSQENSGNNEKGQRQPSNAPVYICGPYSLPKITKSKLEAFSLLQNLSNIASAKHVADVPSKDHATPETNVTSPLPLSLSVLAEAASSDSSKLDNVGIDEQVFDDNRKRLRDEGHPMEEEDISGESTEQLKFKGATASEDVKTASHQFPYSQEIAFVPDDETPQSDTFKEETYLACLARMVERFAPIPIPECEKDSVSSREQKAKAPLSDENEICEGGSSMSEGNTDESQTFGSQDTYILDVETVVSSQTDDED